MTTPQSPLLPDASTSLPGYVAEELTEELDSGYGSVAAEQDGADEYLVPKRQLSRPTWTPFRIFRGSRRPICWRPPSSSLWANCPTFLAASP
ncbi:hypothetical protein KL942_002835 [Ogataea angusta]|uniref:Uncharacterized protein n=1 Tax=Pichia angusta TaxID=870730 RepID=A0ABQ7RTL2_PICAN|nr:hypothetical protein KL943_003373 [Ogataea angusta]KAG7840036.1 hypothetical protein KL942_002835 [Ogataea angusta]KAG7847364.1 hypothetical protein KL940_003700 [Ogataea angusta]